MELLDITCPRCSTAVRERFYGPCESCRQQLRAQLVALVAAAGFLENVPLGRFGEPEDIASVVCFLASEGAAYVTGTLLVADGGLTDEERMEVERIVRFAFALARQRRHKLTSVDKGNVLEVSAFWREIANRIAKEFTDVQFNSLYVDNTAMQIIREPRQFDLLEERLCGEWRVAAAAGRRPRS